SSGHLHRESVRSRSADADAARHWHEQCQTAPDRSFRQRGDHAGACRSGSLSCEPDAAVFYSGMTMTENAFMPLKVAVVDGEALARAVVLEYLAALPGVEVVAECANGFEAVKAVADLKPDLLLLDVQMPKLDGFEVLELVGRDVAVIFVTAYDQYALRAFE